jgi:hypothetical protein
MGCGCKGNVSNNTKVNFGDLTYKAKLRRVGFYALKGLAFLIGIALLPIINIAIIWFMFNIIVLNKEFNVKDIVFQILGSVLKKRDNEDDDDDDDEEYDEDDVDLLDAEEITYNK